jgi:hypothetical protein
MKKIREMLMKNFHGIPFYSMEFNGIFHGNFHELTERFSPGGV